jgi:hypothetical protein
MAIELSNITFTDQGDIVPMFGVEKIFNTGITNTLAGDDIITGDNANSSSTSENRLSGITNTGTLNTDGGNDILTGIFNDQNINFFAGFGIDNRKGTINTGDGNDTITGIIQINRRAIGIFYDESTIDTGDGNDAIVGFTPRGSAIVGGQSGRNSILNTGTGNDTITGTSLTSGAGVFFGPNSSVDTGDGDDVITGNGDAGILNNGILNTGNGKDSLISIGRFLNGGNIFLGDGDDIITSPSFLMNEGTINTGNGKDSIIADEGFNGSGNVFLGNGQDYLKGFGSGNFNGENGKDTLELTSGSYTIGISGVTVNFIKDSIIMNTSDFEELIASGTTYNFSSFTNGQTIIVA